MEMREAVFESLEGKKVLPMMREIVFEPLEGCNDAFERMMVCACCGTQGGRICGCGPRV